MSPQNKIAMVAYTHYETDPRVKREAEAVQSFGNYVEFICLKEENYEHARTVNNIRVTPLSPFRYRGNSNVFYIFSYVIFFLNIFFYLSLKPLRYKVVHFHTMPDFIVFSALLHKLFRKKIILDFHDVMHKLYINRFSNSLLVKAIKLQTKLAARFADRIITVNESCKRIYQDLGIDENKIILIFNYPDERIFYPQNVQSDDSNNFVICCHGTIMERLGFDTLVRSILILREKIPNVRLRLLGKGDYESPIRELLHEFGLNSITTFPEEKRNVEEVPKFLYPCHLGIVPTKIGPGTDIMLPLKLLEYAALDIPVISTPLPAVRELFGENIIYFDSDDENDLAEKILYYFNNRESLEKKMKTFMMHFRKKYNWNNETLKLNELYTDIIHSRM